MLECEASESPLQRPAGQLIPTARRATYSAFLTAAPRLMEPIYSIEITAPGDCVDSIQKVLQRRRGHIVSDTAKSGAPFCTIKAFIPVMDSFGFETDLRAHTQGSAYCQMVFDHWAIVPGDPLDKDVILHPLEPSPPIALARDFMLKTRRRKGLGDDVSVLKYLDDPELMAAADELEL